jgi:hypothetical protein
VAPPVAATPPAVSPAASAPVEPAAAAPTAAVPAPDSPTLAAPAYAAPGDATAAFAAPAIPPYASTEGAPPAGGVPPVPPTKRRPPLWIWFAGGFSLLLIIVLIVVAVVRNSEPDPSPVADPTSEPSVEPTTEPEVSSTPTATPRPSSTPRPTPSPTATETGSGGAATDYIALDSFAEFESGTPAMWGYPTPAGWEITMMGQDGLAQISNTTLSCLYTTSQSYQTAIDTAATSDQSDTAATLITVEEAFASQAEDSSITALDNVDLSYGLPGGDSKIEFVSSRVDYTRADTGEKYSTIFVVRATPKVEGLLYASVNCPSDLFGSAEDPTQELFDGSTVIPSY